MPVASMSIGADGGTQILDSPGTFDRGSNSSTRLVGVILPPLLARLELDREVSNISTVGVGRVSPALPCEYACHFGHGLDQTVGLLQCSDAFPAERPGKADGHVEEIAFVQRRHELARPMWVAG